MMIICMQIQIMMRIFRRRKSKESLIHLFDLHPEKPSLLSTSSSKKVRKSKVRTLSVPITYPRSKRSVTFDFDPTPATPVPVATPTAPSEPLSNRRALRRAKKQKMNHTQKEKDMSTNFLLGLLDSLPLPNHYKTNHLLDHLADLVQEVNLQLSLLESIIPNNILFFLKMNIIIHSPGGFAHIFLAVRT